MIRTHLPIYLASKSPRRKKLLEQINLKFRVIGVDTDEKFKESETPIQNAKRIAKEKMEAAKLIIREGIIITADTIVVLDNKILGKPTDEQDAKRILKLLSGRTHFVITAFAVYNSDTEKTYPGYERTSVTFRMLEDDEIDEYIRSGSPMDKAGAYGIQDDYGAVFIKRIDGCYYNVVGLPLAKVYSTLLKAV
jgi:septum formation protein